MPMGVQEISISDKMDFSEADHFFKTIGEVSAEIGVPPHVLRFWESKFLAIKPHKRRGGHRYYSEVDIKAIYEIKKLLYDQGYTIKGAQKYLKEKGFMTSADISNQHSLFDSEAQTPPVPQKIELVEPVEMDLLESATKSDDSINADVIKSLLEELQSIKKALA